MLNMIVDSLDELPEDVRAEYEERDGKFQLQVSGAFSKIDRDKLTESLRKERDISKTAGAGVKAFGTWTPETIHTLEGERDQLSIELAASKKEGGPTDEDIDKIVEARVVARLAPVERKLNQSTELVQSLTGERDSLAKAQTKGKILRAVVGAFGAKDLGANPDASVDVELWAAGNFEVDDDGKVVSKDGPGIVPGLNPGEVFKDMRDNNQRPHWFGRTVGAGASGSDGGKNNDGDNPFKINKDTGRPVNFTQASAMVRDDPARAKRLAQAAGAQRFFKSLFPEA
jgi:hypothetical protein